MKLILPVSIVIFAFCSIIGCKSGRVIPAQIFTSENYCQVLSPATTYYDTLLANQIKADTSFLQAIQTRFTRRALSVAADIGVQSLLTEYVQVEKQNLQKQTADNLLGMVAIRQELAERISLASLEVNSVLSEMNCEIGRATEMKNYLQLQLDKRETSSTILSVLAAAAAQVVVSIFNLTDTEQRVIEITEVTGALVSGYFAYRALKKKDIKSTFLHKRNFLRDIRDNPQNSAVYQPIVWHYLTNDYKEREDTPTVRQTILNRWQELNLLTETEEKEQQQRIELLFGQGGLYSIDDIDNRISLLDLLVIEVSLMNQELKQLQQEITAGSLMKR